MAAEHALPAEVRLFDYLFTKPNPQEGDDDDEAGEKPKDKFLDNLNSDSLRVMDALVEPSLATAQPGDKFQFMREGYFCVDVDSRPDALVFNRTVGLKDTWAKGK